MTQEHYGPKDFDAVGWADHEGLLHGVDVTLSEDGWDVTAANTAWCGMAVDPALDAVEALSVYVGEFLLIRLGTAPAACRECVDQRLLDGFGKSGARGLLEVVD